MYPNMKSEFLRYTESHSRIYAIFARYIEVGYFYDITWYEIDATFHVLIGKISRTENTLYKDPLPKVRMFIYRNKELLNWKKHIQKRRKKQCN